MEPGSSPVLLPQTKGFVIMLGTQTIKRINEIEHNGRFMTRPAELQDAEAVASLLNACSIEQIGRPEWEAHELETDWRNPIIDLANDTCVVATGDGDLVGYADVWDEAPHVRIYSLARVHPRFRKQGIGTALCQWVEDRARHSIDAAPAGTRIALLQSTLASDAPAQELLRTMGFQVARYFYQMVIEMEGPPPLPRLVEGIEIRPFVRHQEEAAVIQAVRDAFKDHWGYVEGPFEDELKESLHWMENDPYFDPSLWFIAIDGDEIAGMSLCYPRRVEDPELGWVSTLGVCRPWRRKGLGLALLRYSFGEFYRRGKHKVGLGVDAESLTGATRLYERAGMRVHRQYATCEKELRAGVDLSTQSVRV
jgi:mycothiol synthase